MSGLTDIIFANTKNYSGEVDTRFHDLAEQFSRLQDGRTDFGGAALAVYFRGQKVIDIYTGKKSKSEQWDASTLSVCYSTGKGILATLAHILVSEGFLNYESKIAEFWPEFSQNGKSQITLRHILSHQSGLYDIRNITQSASEMADWEHMLTVVQQATPRFAVGQDIAYQALTFGWLVGGVLEKATGRSLTELMERYLVQPLQLDGAYFGVPGSELVRVARPLPKEKQQDVTTPSSTKIKKNKKSNFSDKLMQLSGQNPQDFVDAMVPHDMRNFSFFSDDGLQAIIPAANGAFTARSLAKVYAMLANGGVWDDQEIIKPEVFSQLSKIQSIKRDRVMPIPMKWRLGYHRVITMGKRAKKGFGHIGYNGSGAWCDPQRELSFAYTHNFRIGSITGDYRLWGLSQETLRCADAVIKGHKGWF
nr:serine hydrolase domain-containing protein [Acinetobacter sp. Marseille-Q1620]